MFAKRANGLNKNLTFRRLSHTGLRISGSGALRYGGRGLRGGEVGFEPLNVAAYAEYGACVDEALGKDPADGRVDLSRRRNKQCNKRKSHSKK